MGKVSPTKNQPNQRRSYDREFKQEAVRMFLDGQSASAVAERLGISTPNLIYQWKAQELDQGGATSQHLDQRLKELEEELRQTQRERDVLKKALAIFSRQI